MMDQTDGVEAMGFLFKQRYTTPLPKSAKIKMRRRRATAKELGSNPDSATVAEEIASWRDKSGEKQEGVVVGGRVRMESGVWMARYRDASGLLQEVSTGCRDKSNAAIFLADIESTVERIKLGVVTETELDTKEAGDVEIATQIEAYLSSLKNKRGKGRRERVSDSHLVNVRRSLYRIVKGCSFTSIRDILRESVAQWVTDCLNDVNLDWSSRTINSHIESLKSFCSWCVDAKPQRLVVNPMSKFPMLGENAKRPRRALTITEVERLLAVARLRPAAEYGREIVRKNADEMPADANSRSTWKRAALQFDGIEQSFERGKIALKKSPEKLDELERIGRERELLYLVLVTTGLRQGELQSITIGQTHLDESSAWLELSHHDEKSGNGASIPLRDDVAERLRKHLSERLDSINSESRVLAMSGRLARLPLEMPLLTVPDKLVRILDRDLAAAGIPKIDERGRSVDVHAMRHTFATMLSTSGVSPRVAQEAMRHSTMELTMKVYTDPKLLDVAGAVASLPSMNPAPIRKQMEATGTDGKKLYPLTLTPAGVLLCQKQSIPGTLGGVTVDRLENEKTPVLLVNTGVFDSRGERIRTFDPLVPNQMR